ISWTLVYDTIYALQDKKDDLASGQVKSTAITFGEHVKWWLTGFSTISVAGFACAGYMAGLGPAYYLLGVGGPALHYAWQITTLRVESVKDCWSKFVANRWIGLMVAAGLTVDWLTMDWLAEALASL
ncbi:hypothetical protein HDU91_002995, partial [Kappamyces sp. JEL0680]